jgi:hypothetical protein
MPHHARAATPPASAHLACFACSFQQSNLSLCLSLVLSHTSQVLVAYGNRVLSVPSNSDPYAAKYKGIWVCLTILSRALSGNYVNFGVFDLYGDPALKVFCRVTPCDSVVRLDVSSTCPGA